MKLEFWTPKNVDGIIKATVHQSGKLGFSTGAAKFMKLDERKFIRVAFNADDQKDDSLYIMVIDKKEENTIRINKAGDYFYVNLKDFFDEKGFEYRKIKIIYDIIEKQIDNNKFYKFLRREKDRKK